MDIYNLAQFYLYAKLRSDTMPLNNPFLELPLYIEVFTPHFLEIFISTHYIYIQLNLYTYILMK